MKVIDLLNKIANGEAPKKIKHDTINYFFRNYDYKEIREGLIDEQSSWLEKIDFYKFDDEVEVIEEDKKIEKLEYIVDEDGILFIDGFDDYREQKLQIVNKINEIIDKMNKGE